MIGRIKNENEKLKDIATLLVHDASNNPLNNYLDPIKLDYSINSLREVDAYLEKVRKDKKKLNQKEIEKIILRTGSYLGEVIRNKNKKRFVWISYEEGSKIDYSLNKMEKDLLTSFMIYDLNKKSFLFTLNKPYKFLEHGKQDSLWAFAKVVLEEHEK